MSNTLKLGNGKWATGKDTLLSFSDTNNNYKPLAFSFSRDTSATVINKDGLIETVGSGEPRIDFKDNTKGALLLEPSRTNVLLQSNKFDTTWLKNNVTILGGQSGIYGSSDAWLLQRGDGLARFLYQNVSISSSSTLSVYAKKGNSDWLFLSSGAGENKYFDLENGVIGNVGTASNSQIESVGNGWYRCSITVSNGESRIYPAIGDGAVSGLVGANIYIQHAQLEVGSYPTSIIPTSGSAVTRVADSSSQTVPDGVIGQTEGTVFLDFKPQTLDGTSRYLSIENSSSVGSGWMGVFASLVSGTIRFRFYGDGWDIDSSLMIEKGTRYKIAFSYKNGVQTSIYVNGNLLNNITASLSGKSYQKIRLSEGAIGNRGDADFNDIKLYDTIKTDQELIALTS